jgi:hypothetical protein
VLFRSPDHINQEKAQEGEYEKVRGIVPMRATDLAPVTCCRAHFQLSRACVLPPPLKHAGRAPRLRRAAA